jgi:hypothetical protein
MEHLMTTPNDTSFVSVGAGGTAFVGEDGVRLFQAMSLRAGLRIYAKTGMKPNRLWTPKAMIALASSITGKAYKGRSRYDQAIADLDVWIAAAKASLPVVGAR